MPGLRRRMTPAPPKAKRPRAQAPRVGSALEEEFALQLRAAKLPHPVREHVFAPPRRWRFDFAWPAQMAAIEVEGATWSGGRHVRGSGFEQDAEKYGRAAILGWRVVRVTGAMVKDGRALAWAQELLQAQ